MLTKLWTAIKVYAKGFAVILFALLIAAIFIGPLFLYEKGLVGGWLTIIYYVIVFPTISGIAVSD